MHLHLKSHRNRIYCFSTITATLLVSLVYPVYGQIGTYNPVAQTPSTGEVTPPPQNPKVQAQRLVETGTKQLDDSENQAALQSFQQALAIYRQMKDRQGEGKALQGMANAYLNFSRPKSLAIADIPLVQFSCNLSTIFSEITPEHGSGARLNLTTWLNYQFYLCFDSKWAIQR